MGELEQVQKMADRPLNELLTRDMVDIYIGPSSTHWILHEKLLCARSAFFRRTFYTSRKTTPNSTSASSPATKALGLPDDDDSAFTSFVAWLYSSTVPPALIENDLSPLFDLYLMAERWGIPNLADGTLEAVRAYYERTDTFPGLRRVQYVYANTAEGCRMRAFLVGCVARLFGEKGVPGHWEKALRRDGVLATDVILKIAEWGVLGSADIPDVRRGEEAEKRVGKEEEGKEEGASDKSEDDANHGVKQEDAEGSRFNLKTLDNELPSGLVNGVH